MTVALLEPSVEASGLSNKSVNIYHWTDRNSLEGFSLFLYIIKANHLQK